MFKIISIIIISFFIGCGSPSEFNSKHTVNNGGGKNQPPTATPQSVTVKKNESKIIHLTGVDPEGAPLNIEIVNNPSHGTYKNNIYRPDEDYTGSDSFSFTVFDGVFSSAEAIITITITDSGTPNPKPSTCKPLPKTGQTITYHNNDDGDLKKGATRSYTRDDANGIVTDNVTGLMWQDNESVEKPWVTQANYDAKNYMDTSGDTATTYCENLVLGSYGDWRLPTVDELEFLADSGRRPSIDPVFQYKDGLNFWSNTTNTISISNAFAVMNKGLSIADYDKLYYNNVRCVRREEQNVNTFIRDDAKEVVKDSVTCLIWQDNSASRTTKKVWQDAIEYCQNLTFAGYSDWRLPNKNELISIRDVSRYNPAIKSAFKNIVSDAYYSSTTDANYTSAALYVYFDYGDSGTYYKTGNAYMRCVRSGQ